MRTRTRIRLRITALVEAIGIAISIILGLTYSWWPQGGAAVLLTQLIVACIWGGADTVADAVADAITD